MRARARHRSRRALLLGALAVVAALLLAAPAAWADVLSPENAAPPADQIDNLYWITLAIAAVIFVGVEGLLIWSLVKYRFRRGAPAPAQIRGNAPLELGWTVGAALILVVLTVVTFVYLGDIKNPPASGPAGLRAAGGVEFASINQPEPPGGAPLEIGVNGQQYLWRYDYPNVGDQRVFTYYELVVPVDTTVTLDITSQDVIHSWWIPELGGKADAVPGHTNQTWFKIPEEGVYEGACAELCGENHADMRGRVRALSVADYEAWVEGQAAAITESQEQLAIARREREQAAAE